MDEASVACRESSRLPISFHINLIVTFRFIQNVFQNSSRRCQSAKVAKPVSNDKVMIIINELINKHKKVI